MPSHQPSGPEPPPPPRKLFDTDYEARRIVVAMFDELAKQPPDVRRLIRDWINERLK